MHEVAHWERIAWAVSQELATLTAFASRHESLYLNHSSLDAACCAAGAVLELTTEVVMGRARCAADRSTRDITQQCTTLLPGSA